MIEIFREHVHVHVQKHKLWAIEVPVEWIIGYCLSSVFHFSSHFLCKCPPGKAWASGLCGTEWIIGALSVEVQRQALNPY